MGTIPADLAQYFGHILRILQKLIYLYGWHDLSLDSKEMNSRMVIGSFGNFGIVIVGITFLLACLTTCVGLVTSCSEYFSSLIPKISYKAFALIITIFSFAIANQGLSKILSFSVPIR